MPRGCAPPAQAPGAAAALVIDPGPPCHVLVTVCGCAWVGASRCRLAQHGAIMGNVVNDFLLFSCMALFVTGIVLAAATLLWSTAMVRGPTPGATGQD